jgi:glucose-6-phosphate isomerase
MPRSRPPLALSFYSFRSNPGFEQLVDDRVVERVRALDQRGRARGPQAMKPKSDTLVRIGTERDDKGKVSKNGYGVLHLPWLAEQHPEWPEMIRREVGEIRAAIREAHGVGLKYVIWAGMGGSAEDKAFHQAAGLLKGIRLYLLDSTDPAKARAILDHIQKTDKQPLSKALRKCLVVGMAMGMTSYEPVVNLEKLDGLYRKLKIPNQSNFIYMTLPGSILDQFASKRGFRRVELQPDGGNTTAGRHSGPLTRGSLYPLALGGRDLDTWMEATVLSEAEVAAALKLAGFLDANVRAGRDKLTLFVPDGWKNGSVWTKQDFEESLGKSDELGIKVAIQEKLKLANYWAPKEERQDRCFLIVSVAGEKNPADAKVAALRRAGYPLAVLKLSGEAAVARYMQFIHYAVFGLGYLWKMNFVTQPSVELYKQIAARIHQQAEKRGGIEETTAWRRIAGSALRMKWRGGLTVNFEPLKRLGLLSDEDLQLENGNAAAVYAAVLQRLVREGKVGYGELTFFGDSRYDRPGNLIRKSLDSAADRVFRSRLKMPADVYEGPAMNHSYHEMVIGHGGAFSTIVLSDRQETFKRLEYRPDYHRAQWLATVMALLERGRAVVPLTVRDLSERSRDTLREFFTEVAKRLPRRRG